MSDYYDNKEIYAEIKEIRIATNFTLIEALEFLKVRKIANHLVELQATNEILRDIAITLHNIRADMNG